MKPVRVPVGENGIYYNLYFRQCERQYVSLGATIDYKVNGATHYQSHWQTTSSVGAVKQHEYPTSLYQALCNIADHRSIYSELYEQQIYLWLLYEAQKHSAVTITITQYEWRPVRRSIHAPPVIVTVILYVSRF